MRHDRLGRQWPEAIVGRRSISDGRLSVDLSATGRFLYGVRRSIAGSFLRAWRRLRGGWLAAELNGGHFVGASRTAGRLLVAMRRFDGSRRGGCSEAIRTVVDSRWGDRWMPFVDWRCVFGNRPSVSIISHNGYYVRNRIIRRALPRPCESAPGRSPPPAPRRRPADPTACWPCCPRPIPSSPR